VEASSIASIVPILASRLDPDRFETHAIFLAGDGPLVDELSEAGVVTHVVGWLKGARDPVGALRFARAVARGFDIVHQHFGGRSVRWIGKGIGPRKLVVQVWGRVLEPRGEQPITMRINRADAVIAVSKAVASIVSGPTVRVIYPGIDLGRFREPTPAAIHARRPPVVGTAARLVPIKAIEYLIRSVAAVRKRIGDLRLEIAGSGPELRPLQAEANSLGLADGVRFLGWRPDMATVLPRWDVFILPSLDEGFPIALLEAMAAGLPVIASDVGGVPELVNHGETGFLVRPRDVDGLSERLVYLVPDRQARASMGAAGRRRVRSLFSADRMAAEVATLYEEVLRSPKG